MVYGFAKQSGGQARIYSEVDKGTTLRIYLPRHFGPAEEAPTVAEPTAPSCMTTGETVLVVDDEPVIRMLVMDTLSDLGLAVIEASDGPSGLKILQSDVRIDLLITDVGLPGGMNGRQMVEAARVKRPELKVLFITGYAENAAIGNSHLGHGMHVLSKPFPMDKFVSRIKGILGTS
jgi:CheY-like chemotaxis protein